MSSSSAVDKTDDNNLKMGISLWLSFCLFLCIWFLSRFVRGRRQLRNNLHVIEDGLRRMQAEIERRERENSITYGQGTEKLDEFLQQHIADKLKQNEGTRNGEEHPDNNTTHNDDGQNEAKVADSTVTDKKND